MVAAPSFCNPFLILVGKYRERVSIRVRVIMHPALRLHSGGLCAPAPTRPAPGPLPSTGTWSDSHSRCAATGETWGPVTTGWLVPGKSWDL